MGQHVKIDKFFVNAMGAEKEPGEPPDEDDLVWCRRFLEEETVMTKKVDTHRTSYGWKHDVEKWIEEGLGLPHEHISNGAFIAAALERGHEHKYPSYALHRDEPLNVCFNIKRRKRK